MIAFDIETVPLAKSLCSPYPADDRSPPANYKNEEAIARWREADERMWRAARVKECSLNPRLGRVVCISYASDGEEWLWTARTEDDEARVLTGFWASVERYGQIVGWNSAGFDLPFIITRSIINGVLPTVDVSQYTRRYSNRPHLDLKMALLNWPSGPYKAGEGLDEWALALGLEPKSGHGSLVFDMVQRGAWDELEAYALQDARLTYQIAERVAPYFGVSVPAPVAQ